MLMRFAVVPAKPKDTICARDSYAKDNREIQRIDRALPQDDMKFVQGLTASCNRAEDA